MKLQLFNFIDETLSCLGKNYDLLLDASRDISNFFRKEFQEEEGFVNISYRVKSRSSVKEKIVRNNYYLDRMSPEETLLEMQDLIGIRIECRFNKDEVDIFNKIKEIFCVYIDNDYNTNNIDRRILLKLSDKQPMIQKNGFRIYKIDGLFKTKSGRNLRFELQVKSIVNVFWGEIDHKVLYKNYNYMITENFFRDILGSIRTNLIMIDTQLMLLYNHVESMDAQNYEDNKKQLKVLLSKIIHDVFNTKVREELGIVINFKNNTDVIVDYLFMKCVKQKELSYGDQFIKLLNRITSISNMEMDLESYITFDRPPTYVDSFTRSVGESLINVINEDLFWNMFFKIIFIIEEGSNAESFEEFLYFLRYKFSLVFIDVFKDKDIDYNIQRQVEDILLKKVTDNFAENLSVEYILDLSPKYIEDTIKSVEKILEKNDLDEAIDALKEVK